MKAGPNTKKQPINLFDRTVEVDIFFWSKVFAVEDNF
jgi:hypothetical protein